MKVAYNRLTRSRVLEFPTTTLSPSEHATIQARIHQLPGSTKVVSVPNHSPVIAAINDNIYDGFMDDPLDEQILDPVINALNKNKERCQCCLIGFHTQDECYLRGPNFIPKELKQRINLYNKQFGDKLPAGKQIRQWKPQSIPPVHHHDNHKNKKGNYQRDNGARKNNKCVPFSNHATKNKGASINQLEIPDSNDDIDVIDDSTYDLRQFYPAINSFIADQNAMALSLDKELVDSNPPNICTISLPSTDTT